SQPRPSPNAANCSQLEQVGNPDSLPYFWGSSRSAAELATRSPKGTVSTVSYVASTAQSAQGKLLVSIGWPERCNFRRVSHQSASLAALSSGRRSRYQYPASRMNRLPWTGWSGTPVLGDGYNLWGLGRDGVALARDCEVPRMAVRVK